MTGSAEVLCGIAAFGIVGAAVVAGSMAHDLSREAHSTNSFPS